MLFVRIVLIDVSTVVLLGRVVFGFRLKFRWTVSTLVGLTALGTVYVFAGVWDVFCDRLLTLCCVC